MEKAVPGGAVKHTALQLILPAVCLLAGAEPLVPYIPLDTALPPASPTTVNVARHDVNEVCFALMSSGQLGHDGSGDPYHAGGFWPGETLRNYVFGSGLWIAGIADTDGDGENDYVGLESYDPLSGQSSFAPGRIGDNPNDGLSRLFLSTSARDLIDWPYEFRDKFGNPVVHSPQDIVGITNDVTGVLLFGSNRTGIEVLQRSMAFTIGRMARVIVVVWDITNASDAVPGGPFDIEDAYLGIGSDVDIGWGFSDDRTSFFTWQVTAEGDSIPVMMAYAWDDDFSETPLGGGGEYEPGFVGVKFLTTPGNDTDGIDNDRDGVVDESRSNDIDDDGDGLVDEPDENDELGLVNYTWMGSAHSVRPPPQSTEEIYRVMSCLDLFDCVESTERGDIRFVASAGPFGFPYGMTVRFAVAYVFAPPVGHPDHIELTGDPPRPDPGDPVFAEFLATVLEAQAFFDAGYPDSLERFRIDGTTGDFLSNRLAGPVLVGTSASSPEGIAEVSVYSSTDGGASFETSPMEFVGAHTYAGEVPGTGEWWSAIDYFVQAVDSSYLVERDPAAAPDSLYRITFVPSPSFLSSDSVTGIDLDRPRPLAWLDYDRDGDLDLYLAYRLSYSEHENRLYRNDGGRAFTDVSGESGTGIHGYERAAVGDYDNDGFPDVVLGSAPYEEAPVLVLHNRGDGTFEELSHELGLTDTLDVRAIGWSDVDTDGYIDIVAWTGDNARLYMNRGGEEFVDETAERGLPTLYPGYGAWDLVSFDTDGDADEDLFFVGEVVHYYENDGGRFSLQWVLSVYADAAALLDVNGDSRIDVLLGRYELVLLQNDGDGTFTDVSEAYGLADLPGSSPVVTGDVNADGLPDFLTNDTFAHYFLMDPGRTFFDASSLFLNIDHSRGVSLADADGDGMLDIFKNGLWLSGGFPGGYANNRLEVDLEGTVSNRSAIGAVATLFAGDRRTTWPVRGNGAAPRRLHFGMGEETPDSLLVRWPSGIVQIERDVPVNTLITVLEDSTLVGTGRGEEAGGGLPTAFALSQNYPNPFNPQTTIRFDVPVCQGNEADGGGEGDGGTVQRVTLAIYDIRGRRVRILVDGLYEAGSHRVVWDGRDGQGEQMPSGVYLYRLEAAGRTVTRKMLITK